MYSFITYVKHIFYKRINMKKIDKTNSKILAKLYSLAEDLQYDTVELTYLLMKEQDIDFDEANSLIHNFFDVDEPVNIRKLNSIIEIYVHDSNIEKLQQSLQPYKYPDGSLPLGIRMMIDSAHNVIFSN